MVNIIVRSDNKADPVTQLQQGTYYGKPDWDAMFGDIAKTHEGWVHVNHKFVWSSFARVELRPTLITDVGSEYNNVSVHEFASTGTCIKDMKLYQDHDC